MELKIATQADLERLERDHLLTIEQIASVLGMTYSGAAKLARRGEFGRKVGNQYLATAEELELYRQRALRSNELPMDGRKRRVPASPIVRLKEKVAA